MKNSMIIALLGYLFASILTPVSATADDEFKYIENRESGEFLNNETGPLRVSKIQIGAHSSMWVLEPINGTNYVRLKNRWTGKYIHNQNGQLELGTIQMGWWSAMWESEPVTGTFYVRIKNRWTNQYIHCQNGNLQLTNIQSDWLAAMWRVYPATEPTNQSEILSKNVGVPNESQMLPRNEVPSTGCNCEAKTFRSVSEHSWVEFRLPADSAGRYIKIPDGAYNNYVFPKCNRVHWEGLEFTCDRKLCVWVKRSGNYDADAFCHGSPGNSPYVFYGNR